MSTSQNPSLIIDIKYNVQQAEAEFQKFSSRMENMARRHEQKISSFAGAKIPSSYYVNQEGQLRNHLGKLSELKAQSNSRMLKGDENYVSSSLNAYKEYQGKIQNILGNIKSASGGQITNLQGLASAMKNMSAAAISAGQSLNVSVASGSLGQLLFGGAAGVTISKTLQAKQLELQQGLSDFKSIKKVLAEMYREVNSVLKGYINNATLDDYSESAVREMEDNLDKIQQSIRNTTSLQKQFKTEQQSIVELAEKHNTKLQSGSSISSKIKELWGTPAGKVGIVGGIAAAGVAALAFTTQLGMAAEKTIQMERAFKKLGGDESLLQKLRAGSLGQMSDTKLLGLANYGAKLGIDIQQLPQLLKFASVRAKETGQNIDYLVESLVMGLGRKSPMILDNLGLKMQELDDEIINIMKSQGLHVDKVGELERQYFLTAAATEVAKKSIEQTGVSLEDSSMKVMGLSVSWDNFVTSLGKTPVVQGVTTVVAGVLDRFAFALEKMKSPLDLDFDLAYMFDRSLKKNTDLSASQDHMTEKMKQWVAEYKKAMKEFGNNKPLEKSWLDTLHENIKAQAELRRVTEDRIKTLEGLKLRHKDNLDVLKLLNEELLKQKNIIKELDINRKALTPQGFGDIVHRGPDTIIPDKNFKDRAKEIAGQMQPLENMLTKLHARFQEREQIKAYISELEALASTFELDAEKLQVLNQMIQEFREQIADNPGIRSLQEILPVIQESFQTIGAGIDFLVSKQFQELELMQRRIQLEQEYWNERSELMREAGIQNTAYYTKQKKDYEKVMKDMKEKELQLQAELWEKQQMAAIAGVIMNTAQAIMQAWATTTLLAPYLTGLIAATGALQIATISGQQNPYRVKRNSGGWIYGHGFGDNVGVMLTPGEYVVNRNAARENANLLELINSGANVGTSKAVIINLEVNGNVISEDGWVESRLLPAINRAVSKGFELYNN